MLSDVSVELKDMIVNTIKNAANSPNIYKIEAQLEHTESNWKLPLLRIEGLNIIQDYVNNYLDYTVLTTLLHPAQVIEMLQYAQDLKCTLILTKYHWATFLPLEEGIIIKQYRAIIENIEDLTKKFNVREYNQFQSKPENATIQASDISARIPINIQLLDEDIYTKRHIKINTIFNQDITVEQVIYWILNVFNITNIVMHPINNNTYKFKNLKIPPVHGLDSVFEYIHNTYGIYSKGFSHYHFDTVSYLWGIYDHQAKSKNTIKLYSAPNIPLDNHNGYHYIEKDTNDIHIVTTSKVELQSPLLKGSENIGTTMSIHNSDLAIDGYKSVDNKGKLHINSNTTSYISNSESTLHKKTSNNFTYRNAGSNPFLLASELAAYQGVLFRCQWRMSVPYSLYPAQSVIVHYDDKDGVFVTQKGILNGVSYQSVKSEYNIHNSPFFIFISTLQFWLEPDPINNQ